MKKSTATIMFDMVAFEKALRRELKEAHREIAELLLGTAQSYASSLPFKDNPVKVGTRLPVAGQASVNEIHLTSDAKRKWALVNSIKSHTLASEQFQYKGIVKAMETNFKDSHIGLYYEYGTGEKSNDMVDLDGPNRNPARSGKAIVSRSKYTDYGVGIPGVWYDLGHNLRVTDSPNAGVHSTGFYRYIGEDTEAHMWFHRAVNDTKDQVRDILVSHVQKLNPAKFMILADRIKIGMPYRS